jgi:hypothetical protein
VDAARFLCAYRLTARTIVPALPRGVAAWTTIAAGGLTVTALAVRLTITALAVTALAIAALAIAGLAITGLKIAAFAARVGTPVIMARIAAALFGAGHMPELAGFAFFCGKRVEHRAARCRTTPFATQVRIA